jgi:long-chain acyl-CoA synthetase
VAARDQADCLLVKKDGRYQPISAQEIADRVLRLATALTAHGIQPGDRIALMAENGPHWPIVDFATLSIGAVVVPIYPTLTPDQAAYIANDCGARWLVVQGAERLDGMLSERGAMPRIEKVIAIMDDNDKSSVPTLAETCTTSQPMDLKALKESVATIQPQDLATYIYTSGTTGKPKGVMLSHGNLCSNIVNCLKVMDIQGDYTALSFLPLSHSFERTVAYLYFYRGVTIAYAESVNKVPQNLREVRPHLFVSVPRVYEKMLGKIHESVALSSKMKQRIFKWAKTVAREVLPYRLKNKNPPGLLGLKLAVADRLVFEKIRNHLGGRFVYANSGGAPLGKDVAEFFWGAGVRIFEGYGLSETSPVLSVNGSGCVKLGTVGPAIPETELRIADDGEILARGPQIMQGYNNLPDATANSIDPEGWFHTGDIGEIDAEGFLKITDRKKELIVNAYGKNVAPAPIENQLKSSRLIAQAIVVGDRRKILSALIVPDFNTLRAWAQQHSLSTSAIEDLIPLPEIKNLYQREVDKVNGELARFQQVRIWTLLSSEFTIESGELTPTQKIKRRVISENYYDTIERLYENAEASN